MQRLQAFKYELMPTGDQQLDLRRFAGSRRFVFNKALALQKARYEQGEKKLGYAGLCKLLTEWRNGSETPWLKDAPTLPAHRTRCEPPRRPPPPPPTNTKSPCFERCMPLEVTRRTLLHCALTLGCVALTAPATAQPAGASTSLFGITLGQPLRGFAQCKEPEHVFPKKTLPCYAVTGGTPLASTTGNASVFFPEGELPRWAKEPRLGIYLRRGKVDSVSLHTTGMPEQRAVHAQLEAKFGPADHLGTSSWVTIDGIPSPIWVAEWRRPGGAQVWLLGATRDNLGGGQVHAETRQFIEARERARNEGRRPL